MTVKIDHKHPNAIADILKKYGQAKRIAVGFPADTDSVIAQYPDGNRILDVAVQNNFGTEDIPRRDFMTPGGEAGSRKATALARKKIKDLNDGKISLDALQEQMGAIGAGAISEAIIDLKEPPNAPSTIAKKGSSNPLVENGLLIQTPTWKVLE